MTVYAIFFICAGCGAVSGVLYDIFYITRSLICRKPAETYTLKGKIAAGVCDALYFAALSFLFVFCSVKFSFPAIRLYMTAATACGIALYIKSFHKCIAFLVKKLYNKKVKR